LHFTSQTKTGGSDCIPSSCKYAKSVECSQEGLYPDAGQPRDDVLEIARPECQKGYIGATRAAEISATALVIIFVLFFGYLSYTGYLTGIHAFHTQNISHIFTESQNHTLEMGVPGNLTSLSLSGAIVGNGSVRVYLLKPGQKLLVLDSDDLSGPVSLHHPLPTNDSSITGLFVDEHPPEAIPNTSSVSANDSGEQSPGQNPTLLKNENKETVLTPHENTSNITLVLNETNITLPEEAGAKPPGNKTTAAISRENMTLDVIPQSNKTSAAIPAENATPPSEITNLTIPLNETNATSGENMTSIVNITPLENMTMNATSPYNETNITTPEEVTWLGIREFRNICIETCSIEPFYTGNITLLMEIEPGTELHLGAVYYSLGEHIEPGIIPENMTQDFSPDGGVPNQTMETNSRLILDLDDFFADPEGESLSYKAKASKIETELEDSLLTIETEDETGMFGIRLVVEDAKNALKTEFWVNVTEPAPPETEAERLVNTFGIDIFSMNRTATGFDINFSFRGVLITLGGVNLSEIQQMKLINIDTAQVRARTTGLTTPTFAMNPLSLTSATITLEKRGPVHAILRCDSFDFQAGACLSWTLTDIPFHDNGTHVTFNADSFSGYAGSNITILNVQSYPSIGGNWTVFFTALGQANLTITAVNSTTYTEMYTDSNLTADDLEIMELRCGDDILFNKTGMISSNKTWFVLANGSMVRLDDTLGQSLPVSGILIEGYTCNTTAQFTVTVRTLGKHTQRFEFGPDTEYAHNEVVQDATSSDGSHIDCCDVNSMYVRLRSPSNLYYPSSTTWSSMSTPYYISGTCDDTNKNYREQATNTEATGSFCPEEGWYDILLLVNVDCGTDCGSTGNEQSDWFANKYQLLFDSRQDWCECGSYEWYTTNYCCGDDSGEDWNGDATFGCCCDGGSIASGNDAICSGYSNYWCIDGTYCTSGSGIVRDPSQTYGASQLTLSGDDIVCGCTSTGHICDTIDAGAAMNGICASSTCDTGLVALSGGVYDSSCSAGHECDSDVTNSGGWGYSRNGYCAQTTCATSVLVADTTGAECGTGTTGCVAAGFADNDEDYQCDSSNAGAVCSTSPDSGNPPTADGICRDSTCDTSTVRVNCGTSCDNTDLTDANMYDSCDSSSGDSCESGAIGTNGFNQEGICAATASGGGSPTCDTSGFVCDAGTYMYSDSVASSYCSEGDECDESFNDGDFSAGDKRYDPDDAYCDNCASLVGEDSDCEQACGANSNCDEQDPFAYIASTGWCYDTDGCNLFCTGEVVDEDNDAVFSMDSGESCACSSNDVTQPKRCDSDYDQASEGVCVDDDGDGAGTAYSCDSTDVCDDGTNFAGSCSVCDTDEACDSNAASGYSRDGTCTGDNACCDSTNSEIAVGSSRTDTDPDDTCESGSMTLERTCDEDPSNGITLRGITTSDTEDCCVSGFTYGTSSTDATPWENCAATCATEGRTCTDLSNIAGGIEEAEEGVCTDTSTCTLGLVRKNGADYVAGCDGGGNIECDDDVNSGSAGYVQNGYCTDGDDTCCAANAVDNSRDGWGSSDDLCASCSVTYSGDECDSDASDGLSTSGYCCEQGGWGCKATGSSGDGELCCGRDELCSDSPFPSSCTGSGGTLCEYDDQTPPVMTFVTPTPANNSRQAGNTHEINVTVTDSATSIDACLLDDGTTNHTMTREGSGTDVYCHYDLPTTDGQDYNLTVWANDSIGNLNQSDQLNFRENNEPSISAADVTPDSPVTTDDLTCTVSGWSDDEGDPEGYYYDWYNDDTLTLSYYSASATNLLLAANTSSGEEWNCTVTPWDGYENGTSYDDVVTIFNTAPTLDGVTDQMDPIMGGAQQEINATSPDDADQDGLTLYCCSDDSDTCTPTPSNQNCTSGNYNALAHPYTDMGCFFDVPSYDGTFYTRCRLHDGTEYSSPIRSTSYTIDSTPPSIDIDSPLNQSYDQNSIDINVTTGDTADACLWNLDGGTNHSMSNDSTTNWFDIITFSGGGLYQLFVYCNDSVGNMGMNDTIWFTANTIKMHLTRIFWPDPLMTDENETVAVNTTVKVNQTMNDIYQINITDQIPWDFTAPASTDVTVYFLDYSEGTQTDITTNATVNVSLLDQSGSLPTLLMANITNISQTDAGGYLHENDSILLVYDIISSQMGASGYRIVYTNATVTDNTSHERSDWLLENITAYEVVLRGYKTISVPDLSNPQNMSVEIILASMGGPTSGIYIADYLPDGANITDLNVTLYNSSKGEWVQLDNSSDYYIDLEHPLDDTLPGGEHVDVYHYNLSYSFQNWDGNLYDNDTIRIEYNVTFLGGGSWILPTITAGYDPQYQKHIRTEMYASANVPSFDVAVEIITSMVSPGDAVRAILRMLNVGGPKAKVDVFVTYSAKTMQGELINERSETFAVVERKERELELKLPGTVDPGMYTFEAFVSYTGREALSTDTFEVTGGAAQAPVLGDYWLYVFIAIIALVLAFMYLRLGRRIGRIERVSPASGPGSAEATIPFHAALSALTAALAGRSGPRGRGFFSSHHFTTSPLIMTVKIMVSLKRASLCRLRQMTFMLVQDKEGGTKWCMPST
jgi:hypothetical protein